MRTGLEEASTNWAGQAVLRACFFGLSETLGLLERDTKDVLHGTGSVLAWSALLTSGWEHLLLPPTVVSQESNDVWLVANAIGILLAHSEGRADLECQILPSDEYFLGKFMASTTSSSSVYRCVKSICAFVRPYSPSTHGCVSESGDYYSPGKRMKARVHAGGPRRNRQGTTVVEVSPFQFHDLPKIMKERAWGSFISASNPLKVNALLFQSNRSGNAGFRPVMTPAFGPRVVEKRSNAKGPSERASAYAAKVSAAASVGGSAVTAPSGT